MTSVAPSRGDVSNRLDIGADSSVYPGGMIAAITPAAAMAPIPGIVMIRRISGHERICSAIVRSTRRSSL
jgi:hypothetical protein